MNYGRANSNAIKLEEPEDTSDVDFATVPYAEELRAVGQALETQKFVSIELEVEGDGYRVRAEVDQRKKIYSCLGAMVKQIMLGFRSSTRKPLTAPTIERHYGAEEVQKLIQNGPARRLHTDAAPDPFSWSNILRQIGAYLESLCDATLLRVAVRDRWITICYRDGSGQVKELKEDVEFFYGYWVKMYLRRRNRSALPIPGEKLPTYLSALEAELRLKT